MRSLTRALGRRLRPAAPPAFDPAAVALPSEDLRYRVHGSRDVEGFLAVGRRCADDLQAALHGIGRELPNFNRILDFGVGCGRTLRWLLPRAPQARFFGTDVDAEAVAWCRAHLASTTFTTNDPLPPLRYPNASFDLIYAISVFTHLDEPYQFQWLGELRRLTRPGGWVVVTLHGERLLEHVPPPLHPLFAAHGFVFVRQDYWRGIFPDWYQAAYHSSAYVREWYSRFFRVAAQLPKGLNDSQDLVLLQRE
jgi:SAM-dependent methyltransferase